MMYGENQSGGKIQHFLFEILAHRGGNLGGEIEIEARYEIFARILIAEIFGQFKPEG